jgi:hypothetical protein
MVSKMIVNRDVRRIGDNILLGIALENAVLDIFTNDAQLQECLEMLEKPHRGLVYTKIGTFGIYSITLNLHHDDTVSMSVDGPDLDGSRNQSTGIWLEKEELRGLLAEVLAGGKAVR